MGKAFDRVIDAANSKGLRMRAQGQNRVQIQAPGHSTADLSVNVTDIGGSVLFWSHSDPTDDVLADLGLTKADLFDEQSGQTYSYGDGRKVHRSPLKRFSQSGVKDGVELYRADKVSAASVVFVVEGEKDVHALESLGAVATCNAGGAGKAHLFDLTPLYGKHVQIVRDMDEPGMKHAQQVAGLLDGKAASISLLEPAVGKDAADHVAAGHDLDGFRPASFPAPIEPVDQEFEAAVEYRMREEQVRVEARRRQSAFGAAELHPKYLSEILGLTVKHDWLVQDLLERKDRLILTGGEGAGKSYLSRQLAVAIGAGVHPFTMTRIEPRRVLVVDAENSEQQWSRNARYVANLSARKGVDPGKNVLVSAGTRLDFTLKADIDSVHRLMDEHKPDLLYIGPLYKLLSKSISNDDDAAPLIMALDGFRERGVTLLMEAHAGHSKSLGGDRDLRPRGSSALMGWPEFGFGLRPMEEDDQMVSLVRWRGDREERDWPTRLRRGVDGEMPWMRADQ